MNTSLADKPYDSVHDYVYEELFCLVN